MSSVSHFDHDAPVHECEPSRRSYDATVGESPPERVAVVVTREPHGSVHVTVRSDVSRWRIRLQPAQESGTRQIVHVFRDTALIASTEVSTARDVSELDPWLRSVIDCVVDGTDCEHTEQTSENGVLSRLSADEAGSQLTRYARIFLQIAQLLGFEPLTSKLYSWLSRVWRGQFSHRVQEFLSVSTAISTHSVLHLLCALLAITLGVVGLVRPELLPVLRSRTAAEDSRSINFEALLCRLCGLGTIVVGAYLLYGLVFATSAT